MNDSYLFDAGWLFFAAWGVTVTAVSVAAFWGDLIPVRHQINQTQPSTDTAGPAEPAAR